MGVLGRDKVRTALATAGGAPRLSLSLSLSLHIANLEHIRQPTLDSGLVLSRFSCERPENVFMCGLFARQVSRR